VKRMRKSGFTLVELLMVIVIIAILMGILLPTVNQVRKRAKIAKATAEIQSLRSAILMYETTYGYLPFVNNADDLLLGYSSSSSLNDSTYELLICYLQNIDPDGGSDPGNPRGMRILEVNTKQGPGRYLDPWGNDYRVALDTDYNGDVKMRGSGDSEPSPRKFPHEIVYSSVAIWSIGPDKEEDFGETAPRDGGYPIDDICSWD